VLALTRRIGIDDRQPIKVRGGQVLHVVVANSEKQRDRTDVVGIARHVERRVADQRVILAFRRQRRDDVRQRRASPAQRL
jgi:hypothetical protein